jgi:transmembrane sensor
MTNKYDFISLVHDEEFVRSILDATNPDEFLEELIRKNPDYKDSIRYAFEFVQINLSNKTKLNQEDYQKILNNLLNYSRKNSPVRSNHIFPKLRVAAMILVIVTLGSVIAYFQYTKDPLTQFAHSNLDTSNQSVIILSDGTAQELKNKDSFIDYKSNEGEVVVLKDSLEEKFVNKNTSLKTVLNQVVVPFGQRQRVLLSDGTMVQLNAGSKLTFPASFSGKTREVYLKGEGYFEVYQNEKVPFIVKTDHLDIKVLGTKFNVSSYDDEQETSAVLVEGKVNVSQKNKLFGNIQFDLSPGQGCFYSNNLQNSVVKEVDVNNYIFWKDGLYKFEDLPLSAVVSRVNKYYNHPVKVDGENLSKTLVSGKLVLSDDISEALQFLAKTIEGRYEKLPDDTYILKQN